MGERERVRLTLDLSETAEELADAIREEFLMLPAVFRMDAEDGEQLVDRGDWADFRRRWMTWKVYSMDPSIVAGFHIVDIRAGTSSAVLRTWNGESFGLDPSAELAARLGKEILDREKRLRRGPPTMRSAENIILQLEPRRNLWFVIRIDHTAVAHRLIPRLAERYLRAKTEYLCRIIDTVDGEVLYATPGAQDAALFALPDLRYVLIDVAKHKNRDGLAPPPLPPVMKDTSPQEPPEDSPVWVLEAVHRAGSLAAVIRAETIRDTILSIGIYSLLAGAFLLLAGGMRRQQDFVERQNEFIASITHELKTPIAVIRAAADNLADGVVRDPARTAKYGGTIKRESGRLSDMIDRLLAYARVGDGSQWNFETIDIRPLTTRLVNGYRAELESAHFEVDLAMPEIPVVISGDTVALEFALGNLISNALKHAREGLYLGIDVRIERSEQEAPPKGGWAVISVSDRGTGVARRERKLVFEAFYRGVAARQTQVPGSGIGLVLVRRVAEAHGGTIRLEKTGESGSTFVIRIPLEARDE